MPFAADRMRHIEARLAKAKQFFQLAAFAEDDAEYPDGVVSLCVTAAINASDAVLVACGLEIQVRRNHDEAPADLRSVGQGGLAISVARLLRLKSKAQYSPEQCSAADVRTAMAQARRAFESAVAECERRMTY